MLSVLITPAEIYTSHLNAIHNKVVSLAIYPLKDEGADSSEARMSLLQEIVRNRASAASIRLALDLEGNMLIPAELYDANHQEVYLKLGLSAPTGYIQADYIPKLGAYNVYAVSEKWLTFQNNPTGAVHVLHASTPFIRLLLHEYAGAPGERIFVALLRGRTHMAAMQNGKLVFYNIFKTETGEDFTYYLLAVCEELGFHPEETHFLLSGTIDMDSPHYQIPRAYLRHLHFMDRPKALKYADRLNQVPQHRFAFIYAIHL
ncbi:MAG: hypothetical protein KatS3mg031_0380 [Chitinophagales bacterium]|nr:MAG: hypothetical protein KatS3mg031_0380 [Chitinophagales bacterium]